MNMDYTLMLCGKDAFSFFLVFLSTCWLQCHAQQPGLDSESWGYFLAMVGINLQ